MNRVLIVDDKDENLYFLQALLGGHGYVVDTARHGAEALVKARAAPPDMVVSDLLMPIMDGYTLLRHWKADPRLQHIPFIVYTATYTEAEDEQLALDLGADSFILKPAEPDVFIARVRQASANVSTGLPSASGRQGADEKDVLKAYSETLIRKLEEKALQLADANQALMQDIAEREKITAALKSREAELSLLIETIPHIVWLANSDGDLTSFNQRWYDYTGLSQGQSVGQGWLDALHPADRATTQQQMVDAFGSGQGCEIEFRMRWMDGSYRWMLGRALPLRDADGRIAKWFGTSTEIDSLKQAKESAVRNEREQRRLAEQLETERARLEMAQLVAKVGSWETDLTTLALAWSAQTYSIFEMPVGSVQTHGSFLERIHPEDFSRVEAAFVDSLRSAATSLVEHRIVMPDGRIKIVEERWRIITDATGTPLRAVGTCQDISDRRALEEQLRWSQRLESVGQLTGGIAHDFNNLLTVILGNGQLLQERLAAHPHLSSWASLVVSAAQRGADLTQRLLAFARKQPLHPRVVNVNRLVESMDPLLRRSLGQHIQIEFERGKGLWSALVDPAQLEGALLNLSINARDAMTGGGHLLIETANRHLGQDYVEHHADVNPGQYVMLAVSDTGTGIAPEHLERVFEPFFTTKDPGKGTGLGLPMVYGFVKQSGGHIEIHSEPGKGTTVSLYLPYSRAAAEDEPDLQDKQPITRGSESVLLVEDDELVRAYAKDQLESLGYAVTVAQSSMQALDMLHAQIDIDLLFTDVMMPGMSGLQLVEAAAKLRPDLKVLYTSGYTEKVIIQQGRVSPGMQLLTKPYGPADLARKLRDVLDDLRPKGN